MPDDAASLVRPSPARPPFRTGILQAVCAAASMAGESSGSVTPGTTPGPDLTREGFVAALEATRAWDSGGVLPAVTLTPDDHHAQTAGFLCEMKEGRFVPLSEWIAP